MFFLFFIIASVLERIKTKHIFQQAVKVGNYLQFYAIKECKNYTKYVIYVKRGLWMVFFLPSDIFSLIGTDGFYPFFAKWNRFKSFEIIGNHN